MTINHFLIYIVRIVAHRHMSTTISAEARLHLFPTGAVFRQHQVATPFLLLSRAASCAPPFAGAL